MLDKLKHPLVIFLLTALLLAPFYVGAADTDGDGHEDGEELANGFSPFNPEPVAIEDSDMDGDGLSDYWEIQFNTDPFSVDTDGDGYNDFMEVDAAYSPTGADSARLEQVIEVSLKEQVMTYKIGGVAWLSWPVSTGKPGSQTPAGEFAIVNKALRPWSKAYGLWMPYWLGLGGGKIRNGSIGIHELPVWPGGYREGSDHLGRPASHGCIRLGVGPAKYLYERVAPGVPVIIK